MTGHPQGTNRGIRASAVITPTSLTITNSTGSAVLGVNTTGLTLDGGVKISSKAGGQLTANSTALIAHAALRVSGKSTGQVTANSTGLLVADQFRVGTLAGAKYISANSTGTKLNTKYFTGNSTGN